GSCPGGTQTTCASQILSNNVRFSLMVNVQRQARVPPPLAPLATPLSRPSLPYSKLSPMRRRCQQNDIQQRALIERLARCNPLRTAISTNNAASLPRKEWHPKDWQFPSPQYRELSRAPAHIVLRDPPSSPIPAFQWNPQ